MTDQTPPSPAAATHESAAHSNGGVLITGANGHLGQRLIPAIAQHRRVVALVRSANAAQALQTVIDALPASARDNVTLTELAYTDVAALREAALDCDEVIHLAGILKESPWSTYREAHEDTTQALLEATQDLPIKRIHYLSIVGSRPDASNPCLASKGRAEQLLLDGPHPATVLQVPMVLGEGDYAAAALNAQARKGLNVVFAVAARDQPLYAGDVVNALLTGSAVPAEFNDQLTLAGPEAVSKRALITRAAALLGKQTRVVGLPRALAIALAKALELVSKNPPVTVPMMDILHHDDHYDPQPACEILGITLTSLDDMMEHVLRNA